MIPAGENLNYDAKSDERDTETKREAMRQNGSRLCNLYFLQKEPKARDDETEAH